MIGPNFLQPTMSATKILYETPRAEITNFQISNIRIDNSSEKRFSGLVISASLYRSAGTLQIPIENSDKLDSIRVHDESEIDKWIFHRNLWKKSNIMKKHSFTYISP